MIALFLENIQVILFEIHSQILLIPHVKNVCIRELTVPNITPVAFL